MALHALVVNWDMPIIIGRTGRDLGLLIARRIGTGLSHDIEHVVEMCDQGLYSGSQR